MSSGRKTEHVVEHIVVDGLCFCVSLIATATDDDNGRFSGKLLLGFFFEE